MESKKKNPTGGRNVTDTDEGVVNEQKNKKQGNTKKKGGKNTAVIGTKVGKKALHASGKKKRGRPPSGIRKGREKSLSKVRITGAKRANSQRRNGFWVLCGKTKGKEQLESRVSRILNGQRGVEAW